MARWPGPRLLLLWALLSAGAHGQVEVTSDYASNLHIRSTVSERSTGLVVQGVDVAGAGLAAAQRRVAALRSESEALMANLTHLNQQLAALTGYQADLHTRLARMRLCSPNTLRDLGEVELPSVPQSQQSRLGRSLAISGDRLVVGAPGQERIYLFGRLADSPEGTSNWTALPRYAALNAVSDPGTSALSGRFGQALALNDLYLVVGAPGPVEPTAASGFVFIYITSSWPTLRAPQFLMGSEILSTTGNFGTAVAVDGDLVAVGGVLDEGPGCVYLFRPGPNGIFGLQARVFSPEPGTTANYFGFSVALHAGLLAVGAPFYSDSIFRRGAVDVFRITANLTHPSARSVWQHRVLAPDASTETQFGLGLALADGHLLVGAHKMATGPSNSGGIYVFAQHAVDTYVLQRRLQASNAATSDALGAALAHSPLDGLIYAGSPSADRPTSNEGTIYVFG
ncbi:uncharacterized protein MONBRDRAFT_24830 [Monosiga brevicollis MX1]|uniref:Uncharacterized protein n=1 Tax=Monosiga brevicollis TaxID=81824 RepID=A9UXV6_MONBE|nr:uncharacterized protein MONBRDRAFT_24830 [Monosiga brevicollis MX1]EDQ89912.1 predicted protein [Monosiga brevicollis MX1]|eukprot:XP_001745334.1 hypothetical protein [Monosiga brevicollis MX1]